MAEKQKTARVFKSKSEERRINLQKGIDSNDICGVGVAGKLPKKVKRVSVIFSGGANESEKSLTFDCKEFKQMLNGFSVDGIVFALSCPIIQVIEQ